MQHAVSAALGETASLSESVLEQNAAALCANLLLAAQQALERPELDLVGLSATGIVRLLMSISACITGTCNKS